MRFELTRRRVFERVWGAPMIKLARKFGLSDRGLAKLCARHGIPVPGRGFWARVASGQKLKRPPLRMPEKGDQIVVIDGSGPRIAPDPQPPEVLAQIEFEGRPENLISILEETGRYHRLVRATRVSLAKRKQDYNRGIVSSGPGALHLRVSPASKVRALRILDAFVKACEIRGFEVRASEPSGQNAGTIVRVHGEDVRLSLEERCRSIPHELTAKEKRELARGFGYGIPKREIVPTGLLVLQIDHFLSKTTWKDNARRQLEACLNEVMVGLVQTAILVVRPQRLEREAAERERKECAKREAIERRQQEILEKGLKQWRYVNRLDEFLVALKGAMEAAAIDSEGSSAQAEWLRWAQAYREEVDPFEELFEEMEEPLSSFYWER
jgi:hypothetical protein